MGFCDYRVLFLVKVYVVNVYVREFYKYQILVIFLKKNYGNRKLIIYFSLFFFKISIVGKVSLILFKKIFKEDYVFLRKNL